MIISLMNLQFASSQIIFSLLLITIFPAISFLSIPEATPKAILKLMDSDGLTIFHVKSHLQKYRIAKYMPESAEEKFEKRTSVTEVPQLDVRTGLQIKEALLLQLDVQRQLHDQLEIQRNLQLRIEQQGKQLKMMFDQQQRSNMSQFKPGDDVAESSENTIPFQD